VVERYGDHALIDVDAVRYQLDDETDTSSMHPWPFPPKSNIGLRFHAAIAVLFGIVSL
jgi:hypothetical protein